ncbi:hypothetical protein GPECTOR_15g515 [Gonium pectorale]|uniref:AAA+ ATPase domain-containing protein n=1 Tax=Gonium pectorale TaxID=33097 RepID=A0A150GLU7_GONPE|nr:hypothetical protein GPECTOR_15g515 [Gonium pectorale]|eukprot:KXZ50829.1 hypothetical protein GPECTOR_15g515 [Gonium pectorale]
MARHIFLTGQPGIGKSTLCQRILQLPFDGNEAGGFYTAEVRDVSGERCGFDVITLDGSKGPLSRTGSAGGRGRQLAEVAEVSGRPDVEVVTVTAANRDALVAQLHSRLVGLLRGGQRGGGGA